MKKQKKLIEILFLSITVGISLFAIFSCKNLNPPSGTKFKIDFTVENKEGGTVSAQVDGEIIKSPASVEKGKKIVFTAIPNNENFTVDSWEGAKPTGHLTAELVVTTDAKVKLRYSRKYKIEFTVENEEGGTVSAEVDGKIIKSPSNVEKGKRIIFTAVPSNKDFDVGSWKGARSTGPLTAELVVIADAKVILKYSKKIGYEMIPVTPPAVIQGKSPAYSICRSDRPWYKGVFVKDRNVTLTPYSIGKHEVPYQLWHKVMKWALDNGYSFENQGAEGSEKLDDEKFGAEPSGSGMQPVVGVNWRDCIVWCNAYTHMLNESDAECVYVVSETDPTVLKNSKGNKTPTTDVSPCDTAYADMNKKGYRLPTEAEWEFAARYQKDNANNNAEEYGSGVWLTKLWSLSGASKPAGFQGLIMPQGENWESLQAHSREFGVYYKYWNGRDNIDDNDVELATVDVMTRKPNALGLYDMSGNVYEWCFDKYISYKDPATGTFTDPIMSHPDAESTFERVLRGGDAGNAGSESVVGRRFGFQPNITTKFWGFRLAYRK